MGPIDPRQLMLLRGAQGPLPQPPSPGQPPQIGGNPGVMMPQVGGTQSYKPGVAEQVMQGLGSLINGVRSAKEQEKQKAAEEAQRDLQLLSLGIPIDQKKTLKRMKQAGIELDFEGTTQPQQPQQGSMMPQPDPMAPSYNGQMQSVSPQAQAQPLPMAPQQGGLWSAMKQKLGLGGGGAVDMNSPAGQWVQQYAKMGQDKMRMEGKRSQHEEFKMDAEKDIIGSEQERAKLMQRIFKGDREAYMQGKMSGLIKMTPFEEKVQAGIQGGLKPEDAQRRAMAMELGLDELEKSMMGLAEKMAPQFGGNLDQAMKYVQDVWQHGKSELKPQRSLDDEMKVRQFALDVMEQYPTVPQAVADVYANAVATGDKATAQQILNKLMETTQDPKTGETSPKFITKGYLDMMVKKESILNDREGRRLQGIGLALQEQGIRQAWKIHQDNYMLGLVGQMRVQSNQTFDNAYRVWANKDSSDEQKQAALNMMAEATTMMEPITVDVGGKKITLKSQQLEVGDVESIFNWISDPEKILKLKGAGVKSEGKPAEPASEFEKFIDKMSKGLKLPAGVVNPSFVP